MKVMLRCTVSLFFIFALTVPLSAKEFLSAEKLTSQAASATVEKYPDSDDVLIDDFIQVVYQADGTSETWDDTAIKILTEKGKRDNRTISLRFNTSYGTNYFDRVEIIKPDGTVVPVNVAEQSKVMVDPSQMSANIYNPNSKVLSLSVPGLEIGDILRYVSHQVESKTVVPDTWSDYQVFEGNNPIEKLTYQVIAPKERPLKKIALKAEVPDTVTFSQMESEDGSHIEYTWQVRNVPRMFDEPNMPARYTVVQRLLVSTIESWEDLSTWYWDLCKPRLETVTPEMEAMAKELTAGCTNTLQKVNAIFSFVSQDIRYMGITPEEEAPGYEPHDVRITFENRYGVCRDKAALLAAMLRLVDIEAFPVIIMAGPKKDEEVPQPFFNHAVTAALGEDGEYILMDSTDENTKDIFPSYLQNMSYLVARPEGETLLTSPVIPAENNLLLIRTTATLSTDGTLEARSSLRFEGINDTVYRGYFSQIKPEERHRFFEGHLKKNMPTAELNEFRVLPEELRDTSQPLVIELSYSADDLLIEGEANRMLNLPRLGGSLGYANFLLGQTGLDEREYPLYTRMTAGIRETLDLEVPAGLGTLNVPGFKPIESEPLTWSLSVDQANGNLHSTNLFLINTVEFSPEQYLVLKENLKDIEYNLRKKLILDVEETGEAVPESDVRILEQSTRNELQDAGHWVQTNHTRVEILTYAGKKEFSEIKIPYNSAWQEVVLAKATVTLPDGTVKKISDDEINLMDAPWVASAPRYPAERILVANLPGVEIGAVLDYEIVSTVAGKPFFSAIESANSHEPIELKTITVSYPETIKLQVRNTGLAEQRTESDGTVTYTWSATNQPAVKHEEELPDWWTFNPTVFVSTGDWESYAHEIRESLVNASTNQPQTEALAGELTSGIADRHARIIALRDWVAENLRQAGPRLTDMPLSAITPADRTITDRYGNNSDLMVVLYTLLQSSGFKPQFVLSGPVPLIPEAAEPLVNVPARPYFNTLLVKVNVEGETVYLDGSSQYAELGTSAFDRRTMINLNDGSTDTLRVAPGKDERSQVRYEMSISESGEAGLTASLSIQGNEYEGYHRIYAEMTPENRRRHYLELVSSISQSAKAASELVTDFDDYPGLLEFSVYADRYAVEDGEYLYFTIPDELDSLLTYRSTVRELPLAWEIYLDHLAEYTIVLPDGYEPAILPKDYSWQAPEGAGSIDISIEYSELANVVHIVQITDLAPALIPAEDFPEIIEASRRLTHPDMRTILLRKKRAE